MIKVFAGHPGLWNINLMQMDWEPVEGLPLGVIAFTDTPTLSHAAKIAEVTT